jgi:hypothetical protein
MEIEHKAKLYKAPPLGQYKINMDQVEQRAPGGSVEKQDKLGHLNDIEYRSKNGPGFHDKKYSLTLIKPKHAMIMPLPKKKADL